MKKFMLNKEIFGWAMFDFANSSYTTVIITALFSLYFKKVVVDSAVEGEGVMMWSITLSISYLLVVIASPVVGVIADYSGQKKRFLFLSYMICIVFTFLLFFVGKGDLIIGMVFIVLSNLGFALGENLISSFLPEIAPPGELGRVSGFGWGVGYIGGILALLASISILGITKDNNFAIRLINPFIAVFFGLSAIPTFLWLKERGVKRKVEHLSEYVNISYNRLKDTYKHIKEFKELIKLLFAFFLYFAGLASIISFATIYAEEVFHFELEELIFLIIVVNITSSAGAFLFGFIQDKIGAKKTLQLSLILWIITTSGIYYISLIESRTGFWIMSIFTGIGVGSVQSATRTLVGLFSPKSKLAEFYGFWGLSGKLSAILGLYSFGFLTYLTGSQKEAFLSILGFFVLGYLFLLLVREKEGIKHAKEYE